MMRNTYRTLYFSSVIFFMVFGSLTFTGCGAKRVATEQQQRSRPGQISTHSEPIGTAKQVAIKALLGTPGSYLGETVQIYAEIYTIEMLAEGSLSASAIVRVSPPDGVSAELLKCEFAKGSPPPSTLEEGQRVTILGKVDAVEESIVLRECRIFDYIVLPPPEIPVPR